MSLARHVPNLLTAGRILVTPLLGCWIVERRWSEALALLVVAGISDGLDGYLARSRGWTSKLGLILDPLADKFLLGVIYVALAWAGASPWWLVGIVFGKDAGILLGAAVLYGTGRRRTFPPRYSGKVSTTVQIVGGVCLMLCAAAGSWSIPLVAPVEGPANRWWAGALAVPIALATLASGADYLWAALGGAESAQGSGRN
jgi:cardiolipin synthase